MKIDILTTFPEMFTGPFDESIVKRAREFGLAEFTVHNLRDWTHDVHRKTDDEQYGGGEGMVMLAEPILAAVDELRLSSGVEPHVIVTTPQGRLYQQRDAEELSRNEHLIIVCGHYKGIDERVMDYLQPDEISIGDYVLTGGELPAMVIVDSVVRLIPGVVGSRSSVEGDSFTSGLLDAPRYTRPREIRGMNVPEVLLGGHHKQIEEWRHRQALERTQNRRPDLYRSYMESQNRHPQKERE